MLLGRYPFLSRARVLAAEKGMQEIGFNEIEAAKARVVESVLRAGAKEFTAPPEPDDTRSVSAYAIGRLLLSVLDNEYYWQKFAQGESALAGAYLRKEAPEQLLEVAKDLFPSAREEGGSYILPLMEYLSFGAGLARSQVEGGVVKLSKPALLELLRHCAFRKAREKPSAKAELQFKQYAEELKEMLPEEVTRSDFKGSYLSLPCIKNVLAGVEEGKRYYASMALAVACRKDGLGKEKAGEIMRAFAHACRKTTHDFTEREAMATLEWVYRRQNLRFNCAALRANGLAPVECAKQCVLSRNRQG